MKPVITLRTLIVPLLAVVTVVGGLALMFTGRAAELGAWRDITVTVTIPNVPKVADLEMKPGDVIYTDPAAMQAGVIDQVTSAPMLMINPDSAGVLQASPNPLMNETVVVFTTRGRQTSEIIATGNQVIQVGQMFTVFTKTAQLRGTIIDIDVD